MNTLKKMICGMSLAALLLTPALKAQGYEDNYDGGYAYEDSQRASYVTPTIALGLLALAAAVAIVSMDHSSGSSSSGHAHS